MIVPSCGMVCPVAVYATAACSVSRFWSSQLGDLRLVDDDLRAVGRGVAARPAAIRRWWRAAVLRRQLHPGRQRTTRWVQQGDHQEDDDQRGRDRSSVV